MQAEYGVEVEGKAFVLRPDTPKQGEVREPRPGESADELGEPLRTYARDAGLVMRPPPVIPNTMYALEATEYAKESGRFLEFHRRLYEVYWKDGRDLGDPAVIGEVAETCGLDAGQLRHRLESRHYESAVTSEFQEATDLGINGIPAFLIGGYLFTGARPYEDFRAVVERVLEDRRTGSPRDGRR